MGSLATLKNKLKPKFAGAYRFDENLVYKLFKARQDKVFEHLAKLGVVFRDGDSVDTMQRKMEIASVTIADSHNSDDNPRHNFKVISKHGKPIVAISEPFVENGNVMVRDVDPGANNLVITGGTA